MADYGISDKAGIDIIYPFKDGVGTRILFIKTLMGQTYTIDFEYNDTIEDIKYRIRDRTGLDTTY